MLVNKNIASRGANQRITFNQGLLKGSGQNNKNMVYIRPKKKKLKGEKGLDIMRRTITLPSSLLCQ